MIEQYLTGKTKRQYLEERVKNTVIIPDAKE
jgi:hypothetical protein